jgi:hypothetical protein
VNKESAETRSMIIGIDTDGGDAELDDLRMSLLDDLSALDIDRIEEVKGSEVPPNTRGVEVLALGKLLAKFAPDAVKIVTGVIRGWLQRSAARSVDLTIDGDTIKLSRVSDADQARLLELFIARHSAS